MARPGGREAEDFAALSSSAPASSAREPSVGAPALVQLPQHERGAPDGQDHRPFDESDGAGRGHRQHRGGCGVAAPLEAAAGAAGDASDGATDTADEASHGGAAQRADGRRGHLGDAGDCAHRAAGQGHRPVAGSATGVGGVVRGTAFLFHRRPSFGSGWARAHVRRGITIHRSRRV
ncbi:hypothetical protein GS461_19720 [Rhodococcus hoagii]|nr:hypothetical protein [Prescottella equi]